MINLNIGLIIDFDYDDYKNLINFMEFTVFNNKKSEFHTVFYIGNESKIQKRIIQFMETKQIKFEVYPSMSPFQLQFYTMRDLEILVSCNKNYLFCNTHKKYFEFLTNYSAFRNYHIQYIEKKKRTVPPISYMTPIR